VLLRAAICRMKYISYIYFRWPHLKNICMEIMSTKHLNFEELMDVRMKCSKQLRDYLAEMNKKWFRNEQEYLNMPKMAIFSHIPFDTRVIYNNVYVDDESLNFLIRENNNGHPMNYFFLLEELTSLLKKSDK